MKILAIGDLHGKFPEKLKREAEKSEFILCSGDFANADKIRKIIFKNWTDKKWHEAVGLKKARQLEKESFDSGLNILKSLDKLNKKVYFVWGNSDFYKEHKAEQEITPGCYDNKIKKMKNLVLIDRRMIKINGLNIIGHGGYVDSTEYIKNPIDKEKKKQEKRLKRYKKTEEKLNNFLQDKKPENSIFLVHYPPYGFFDKINFKSSPMNCKHIGFLPYNKIIKKYKPLLVVCGHMHEYQGIKKLGKTLILNPGIAAEGKAAVIEIDEQKKKIKSIKFLE